MTDPVVPTAHLIPTDQGPAAVRVFPAAGSARGTLLVGHGAGGQRDAADVLALTELTGDGWTVVLVDQPWRVAGRKVATAPPTLDRAWSQVLAVLTEGGHAPDGTDLPRPWVYAGRSAGARVACRTSVQAAPTPAAVVALAFPLHPPGRPERSRAEELATPVRAGIPTLVLQGGRDPMGTPAEIREALGDRLRGVLTLHQVPGNHSPTRDLAALQGYVREFLDNLGRSGPQGGGPRETGPEPGGPPEAGPEPGGPRETGPREGALSDRGGSQPGVASVDRTSSRTGAPSP